MYREKLFYIVKTHTLHLRLPFLSTHTQRPWKLQNNRELLLLVFFTFLSQKKKKKKEKGRSASVRTKGSNVQ